MKREGRAAMRGPWRVRVRGGRERVRSGGGGVEGGEGGALLLLVGGARMEIRSSWPVRAACSTPISSVEASPASSVGCTR